MKTATTHPKFVNDCFKKRIENFFLIIHPSKPSWVMLNRFGMKVAELLNGENSVPDIVRIISAEFEVEKDVVEKDVKKFLLSLQSADMIEPVAAKESTAGKSFFSSLFFYVTKKCNLHCRHCCFPEKQNEYAVELAENDLLNFLDDFYSCGGERIALTGGEPLLRKDLVKSVLKRSVNREVRILTNGTLIDDEFAALIGNYNVSVQVSIDGSNEAIHDSIRGRGAFKAAIKGIEALKRNGMCQRINLNTTLMSKNVTDYKNIISLAHDLEVPFVRFIPLRQVGSACASWSEISCGLLKDECEEFFDYVNQHAREEFPGIKITNGISGFVLDPKKFDKRGNWCSIGKELAVDTNGDIFPCVIMMQKEFCLGNIRTTTVNDLKKSPVLEKLVTALSERKDHNSKCQECMWKNFCQCGCMAMAVDRYDSIWEPDEFCSYRKKLYDEALIKIAQGKTSANIMGGGTECT